MLARAWRGGRLGPGDAGSLPAAEAVVGLARRRTSPWPARGHPPGPTRRWNERVQDSPSTDAPALPGPALRRLTRLGAAIERHFGRPQDVEWAWTGGISSCFRPGPSRLCLSRGLTLANCGGGGSHGRGDAASPTLPLDLDAWLPAMHAAVAPLFELVGVSFGSFQQMLVQEDGVVLRFGDRLPVRPTWVVLLARCGCSGRPGATIPFAGDRPGRGRGPSRVRALEALDRGARRGRVARYRPGGDGLVAPGREPRRRYLPRSLLAAGALYLWLRLLGRTDRFGTLLFSGVENQTSEANLALEQLAVHLRSDPSLLETVASHESSDLWAALEAHPSGRSFLGELRDFLDRYGHRRQCSASPWSRRGGTLPRWCWASFRVLRKRSRDPRSGRQHGKRRATWC